MTDAPREKIVALTFDDGPEPDNDPEILRLLARHGAVATFFVIGARIGDEDALLRQIRDAGCEIGNHGWTHRPLPTLSVAEQLAELVQTRERLAAAGTPAVWFRPPYGSGDAMTAQLVASVGLQPILWSVDSRDWDGSPPEAIRERVIEGMAPGAVILLHSPAASTLAALPEILDFATAEGYRCVTLTTWKQITSTWA